jgi:hypothetical protein
MQIFRISWIFCGLVAVQCPNIDEMCILSLLSLKGNASSQDHSLLF